MLTNLQNTLIIVGTVVASGAFLFLLSRVWHIEKRRQYNDLIGWNVSVLGTTYAVAMGFMLYAVWTNFEIAGANAEAEANCVVNMVRSARGLPSEQRGVIRSLGAQYVDIMLEREWPAMSRGALSPESHRTVQQLWAAVTSTEARSGLEQTSLDHTFSELSNMTDHRRLRQVQVVSSLPEILWIVLIVGAIVTIVSACLFGTLDFKLHLIQVTMLALMLSLILVAIADINRPFQGSVHVPPVAFEKAKQTIADAR